MLGVVAKAMDRKVDVIVVLAGTRVALWQQTYQRLLSQLDGHEDPGAEAWQGDRILVPRTEMAGSGQEERASLAALYSVQRAAAGRALERRRPILMVVMKHTQHLYAAAEVLRRNVYPHIDGMDRDLRLLVVDDEADDGSILDAAVEQDLDPATDHLKQIPRYVVDLWSERANAPATVHQRLRAVYVGYTATPQANFLQSDQNPLAPRDFICALRTPADHGDVDYREPTYQEPSGLKAYYTGGDAFYRRPRPAEHRFSVLTVPQPLGESAAGGRVSRTAWTVDSLRAYLVAAALRPTVCDADRGLISNQTFDSMLDALEASPPPHSMLLHPAASVDSHFEAAADLVAWAHSTTPDVALEFLAGGLRDLSGTGIREDMDERPEAWSAWLDAYRESAEVIATAYESQPEDAGSWPDWPEVKTRILERLLPHVRISIVNSDPEADDRPEFEPRANDDGRWRTARDLLTVFVSGNVMARGLTLEGLTTAVFLRQAEGPVADTQMQMQRWFGYRGSYLHLCRVFAPADQLALFQQYHETDEALRRQILNEMNRSGVLAPRPLVLEGSGFAATGKIAGVAKVPLCPGAAPFVDFVNDPAEPDPNMKLVADIFAFNTEEVVTGKTVRGLIRQDSLSMDEAADLLDSLRYKSYHPSPQDILVDRWEALRSQLGSDDSGHPETFFRPPASDEPLASTIDPRHCPYTIAAYLRFWGAALSHKAPGLFPTDDAATPWNRLNLVERRRMSPRFHVGLRFGSLPSESQALEVLGEDFRTVSRRFERGRISGTWGTQGDTSDDAQYRGDRWFDYAYRGEPVPQFGAGGASRWRPVGAPGLILFYVCRDERYENLVVAVGACLPLGGPDHFAARVRRPDEFVAG
jgi:hypothetical protein